MTHRFHLLFGCSLEFVKPSYADTAQASRPPGVPGSGRVGSLVGSQPPHGPGSRVAAAPWAGSGVAADRDGAAALGALRPRQ